MNIDIGTKYRFSIYGAIGDNSHFEATAIGLTEGRYLPFDSNANVNHANIYPGLPAEVKAQMSDDYTSYRYYSFISDGGVQYYIGSPWIRSETIEELSAQELVIKIDNFEGTDYTPIYKALEKIGANVTSIYKQ